MIVLRNAQPDDWLAAARVQVAGWQRTYAGVMPDDFLNNLTPNVSFGWRRGAYTNPPFHAVFLVACEGRDVRAFCDVGQSRSDDRDDITGELYAIYTDPAHTGRGIGSCLMTAARRHLARLGHRRAELWVEQNNQGARRFYERHGWESADTKKEAFGGTDIVEVRYVRDL